MEKAKSKEYHIISFEHVNSIRTSHFAWISWKLFINNRFLIENWRKIAPRPVNLTAEWK